MAELAFMIFGLGFFLFVIQMVLNQNNVDYNRKLNEQREFGYQATHKSNTKVKPPT